MMGAIKEVSRLSSEVLQFKGEVSVSAVIERLISLHGGAFKQSLLDPILENPQPNALILLNGVEINNLQGLHTLLGDGDELVLLSVTHGG
jgi:molybdopterin converting factor small subunit